MITIIAKSIVKEGKVEEYKALAQELIEESRKVGNKFICKSLIMK